MPRPILVRSGDIYGRLTVIREVYGYYDRRFEMVCECGKTVIARLLNLRRKHTRSCGCLQREICTTVNITHGKSYSQEYKIWSGMVKRCTDEKCKAFKDYGGRGITVCDEWLHDFPAFFAHVGPRPSPKHSINRINNDLGYAPGNVEWATGDEQARNTRRNMWITFQGERRLLIDVCRQLGVSYRTTIQRHRKLGWPDEDLFKPVQHKQVKSDSPAQARQPASEPRQGTLW